MFRQYLLAALFTDRAIHGRKGIDIKFRLGLYRALRQRGLAEPEVKGAMLRALPLELGGKFPTVAGILTIMGGALFIGLASESTRDFVLRLHRVSGGPIDYVLLAIQWLGFYAGISLLASAFAVIAAVAVYASRIWKFL